MKERIAQGWHLLCQDGKKLWWTLPAFLLYCVIGKGLFGQVCPFRILFGIPCPGCGFTRALRCLAVGDFLEAFQMYPLALAILFLLLSAGILRYGMHQDLRVLRPALWTLLLLCLVVYGVRMFLYFPDVPPLTFRDDALLPRLWETARRLVTTR